MTVLVLDGALSPPKTDPFVMTMLKKLTVPEIESIKRKVSNSRERFNKYEGTLTQQENLSNWRKWLT